MGLLLYLTLWSVKWSMLLLALLLGFLKAAIWFATRSVGALSHVWLRARPLRFTVGGVRFRLIRCGVGFLDVDFLSRWLRSSGKLPCLSVVVGGLEFHLEACLTDNSGDNEESTTTPSAASAPPCSNRVYDIGCSAWGSLSPFWSQLLASVLKQCKVTALSSRIVVSSRESEGPQDGYWQEFVGLSWNRSDVEGMVADLHVSSVEVSARPLAGGDDGLTLLLRVQNEPGKALISSPALGDENSIFLDGHLTVEVDTVREIPEDENPPKRPFVVSAARAHASPIHAVLGEGDMEGLATLLNSMSSRASTSSSGAARRGTILSEEGTPSDSAAASDPTLCVANDITTTVEDVSRDGGLPEGLAVTKEPHQDARGVFPSNLWEAVSRNFILRVDFEAFRVEVLCKDGVSLIGSRGENQTRQGAPVVHNNDNPCPSLVDGALGEKQAEVCVASSALEYGTMDYRLARPERMGAVAEIRGVGVCMRVGGESETSDADSPRKMEEPIIKASIVAKWNSILVGAGRHARQNGQGSDPLRGSRESRLPCDDTTMARDSAKDMGVGEDTDVLPGRARRFCFPVHVGKMSYYAEVTAHRDSPGNSLVKVDASSRVAFCRLQLCNEGLSVLSWAANRLRVPPQRISLPDAPLREQQSPPSPAGTTFRLSHDTALDIDRADLIIEGDEGCSKHELLDSVNRNNWRTESPLRDPGKFEASESSICEPEHSGVECRSRTLLRLSIPRTKIRARSGSVQNIPAQTDRARGQGGRREQLYGIPGRASELNAFFATVTTEWIEGYLEVDDPYAGVEPRIFPPTVLCTTSSPSKAAQPGIPAKQEPSSLESSAALPVTLPPSDVPDSTAAEIPQPKDSEDQFPVSRTNEPVEPSARSGYVDGMSHSNSPPPNGHTYRLRWLMVHRVSVMIGSSEGTSSMGVGVAHTDHAINANARGVYDNVRSKHGTLFARKSPSLGGKKAGAQRDFGPVLEIEGIRAEWTPALFFLLGKAGAMVIARIKDAGLLPLNAGTGGRGYRPLSNWSPSRLMPIPSSGMSEAPVQGTPRMTHEPNAESSSETMIGPSPGFPAVSLGLPPVDLQSRADACFANEIFLSGIVGSSLDPMNSDDQGNTEGRPPAGDDRHRNSEDYGSDHVEDDHRETGNAIRTGGRGKLAQRDEEQRAGGQILTVSARDIRVDFLFVLTEGLGDMEFGDVLHWLRMFRPMVDNDGTRMLHEKPSSEPLCASNPGDAPPSKLDEVGTNGAHSPHPTSELATWSCQHVEAESFGLSVCIDGVGGNGIPDGDGKLTPDLCCAISGISMHFSDFLYGDGQTSDLREKSCSQPLSVASPTPELGVPSGGVARRSSNYEELISVSSHERLQQLDSGELSKSDVSRIAPAASGGGNDEGGTLRVGVLIGPSETDSAPIAAVLAKGSQRERRTFAGAASRRALFMARLAVSLEGSGRIFSVRKRLLYLSRFAVVQMSSASHRGSDGGLDSRGPFRAVDILADGLDADWTPAAHLRIMKPVRDVTLGVWKALLHVRRVLVGIPLQSRSQPIDSPARIQCYNDDGTPNRTSTSSSSELDTGGHRRYYGVSGDSDPRADAVGSVGDNVGGNGGIAKSSMESAGFMPQKTMAGARANEVDALLSAHDRNPDWQDLEALEYWMWAWATGGPSGPGGDTLHRLHVHDVVIRGQWPSQSLPGLRVTASSEPDAKTGCLQPSENTEDDGTSGEVRVGEFMSESIGEHFKFVDTVVTLDGDRLAFVASVGLTRTLGHHPQPSPLPATRRSSSRSRGGEREAMSSSSMSMFTGDLDSIGLKEEGSITGSSCRRCSTYSHLSDDDESILRPLPQSSTHSEGCAERSGEPVLIGACFHELKARALAVHNKLNTPPMNTLGQAVSAGSLLCKAVDPEGTTLGCNAIHLPSWVMPLVTRPEGFQVEIEGVVIRAEQGKELGRQLDSLSTQVRGLAAAFSQIPGRWHPYRGRSCGDFHRLFWNPIKPEEAFCSASTEAHDSGSGCVQGIPSPVIVIPPSLRSRAWGPHLWLRVRDLSIEIADDPLEAWLESMHPVWDRELATRGFREALIRRRRRLWGPDEKDDEEESARSYVSNVLETFGGGQPPPAFPHVRDNEDACPSKGEYTEGPGPCLVRVSVGWIAADTSPPANGEARCRALLERLDQHPPPVGTEFSTLTRMKVATRCADVRVNLRRFSEPLFSCEAVSATAVTMGAWVKAPPELFDQTCVILDQSAAGKAPRNIVSPAALERVSCGLEDACTDRRCAVDRVILVKRSLPPKIFVDLAVTMERPRFEYSPAHAFSLVDLWRAGKLLCPPRMFKQVASAQGSGGVSPLLWWDTGRSMLHGKVEATLIGGVGFLVANSCATPTEFRLPSREALAEIAIRGFASASAEEKNRRRGSYPPEDDVGVSRSAGDVASSGTADSEVRDRRSEAGRERPGSRISAHFGPTFSRATRRAYPNASARKQERGLGSGSAAFVRGVGDDHERLSRGDSGEDVGDGRGMIQNSTTSTGSYSVASYGTGVSGSSMSSNADIKGLREGKALKVAFVVLRVGWAGDGSVAIESTGVSAEASPPPARGLPPALELPILRCTITTTWQCLGGASPNHWVYLQHLRRSNSPMEKCDKDIDPKSMSISMSKPLTRPDGGWIVGAEESGFALAGVSQAANASIPSASAIGSDPRKCLGSEPPPDAAGDNKAGAKLPNSTSSFNVQQENRGPHFSAEYQDPFESFRARGVSLQVRAKLPNRPKGGDLPPLPLGMELPSDLISDLMSLPPRMSISFFGCCLEWAVEWGSCFSKVPPVPVSKRKYTGGFGLGGRRVSGARFLSKGRVAGKASQPSTQGSTSTRAERELKGTPSGPLDGIAGLVRGLRLGPVALSEVDVSAYDTEPGDPKKRGVRLTIRGGVKSSLAFSVEASGAINPFSTGRVVLPTSSQVVTTVHGLRLRAGRIEARLCDRSASSRGNVLLRIHRVALEQAGEKNAPVSPPRTRACSRSSSTYHAPGASGLREHGEGVPSKGSPRKAEKDNEQGDIREAGVNDARIKGSRGNDQHSSFGGEHDIARRIDDQAEGTRNLASGTNNEEVEGQRAIDNKENRDAGGSVRGWLQSVADGIHYVASDSDDGEEDAKRNRRLLPPARGNVDAHELGVYDSFSVTGNMGSRDGALGTAQRQRRGSFDMVDTPMGGSLLWGSRGGVPPDLGLLPSGRLGDVLSSLGERASVGKTGDADSDTSSDAYSDDSFGLQGCRPNPTRYITANDGWGDGGTSGDMVEGNPDGEPALSNVNPLGEGEGEETWDSHLDAMTRVAWRRSKQASCRAFNSNASSISVASDKSTFSPASGVTAAVWATANAAGASAPSVTGASVDACLGGCDYSPPPALPPRHPGSSNARPALDAAVAGSESTGRDATPMHDACSKAHGERPVPGGGTARGKEEGDSVDRVAGSGFLYRVVVDGLNVLITLKLRDSLLLLAQSALDVATAALPNLDKPSPALLTKETQREVPGELNKRTSLDLKQFIDKPLALPGRRRDSGSLTPQSKAERQSHDGVDLLGDRKIAGPSSGVGSESSVGGGAARAGLGAGAGSRIGRVEVGVGSTGEGQPVMYKLFSIELRRTQIQLLGSETAKASLLYSMEQGVVQGWVGLDPLEESIVMGNKAQQEEGDVESCRLQCLAQRLLTTSREAVTVGLEGTMLSAAPSDVDVDAGVQWLPDSSFGPDLTVNSMQGETAAWEEHSLRGRPARSRSQSVAGSVHEAGAGVGTGGKIGSSFRRRPSQLPSLDKLEDFPMAFTPALSVIHSSRYESEDKTPVSPAGTDTNTAHKREPLMFRSGAWAAAGGTINPSQPSHTSDSEKISRQSCGLADIQSTFADANRSPGRAAAMMPPDSPLSALSGIGGTSGCGSGHWGSEGTGGCLEESPSRAREREARRKLMREARADSGIAATLSNPSFLNMSCGGTGVGSLLDTVGLGNVESPLHLRKGSLLSRGRAVFKPVVNRIDSFELQVLAHHGAVENHVVKIDMPAIQAALNSFHLKLMITVASEVLASPLPNLAMLKKRGSSTQKASYRRDLVHDGASSMSSRISGAFTGDPGIGVGILHPQTVTSAWAAKRKADWERHELRRLKYYIAEASYGMGSLFRTGGKSGGSAGGDAPISPTRMSLRSHSRVSPSNQSYDGGLGRGAPHPLVEWAIAIEDESASSTLRTLSASERLRKAVSLLKLRLQQRPNTSLGIHLACLKLELWRDESSSPFLRAEVRDVRADVMVYDDASGSLDIQVGSLWASQVRGLKVGETAPDGLGPASESISEWWRGGSGSIEQQPLFALEVLKPLMQQDLERLSDQGNLRAWSTRDVVVHVQAQLGSPIGQMTLVRHFEAFVFPLVIHLRRSLFTDLAVFSSDAAVSGVGAAADSGAIQREEQIKASFLTSKKTNAKHGIPGMKRSRLRPWRGKGSTSNAASPVHTAVTSVTTTSTLQDRGSLGGTAPSPNWDSASDVGDVGDEAVEHSYSSKPDAGSAVKDDAPSRDDGAGVFEKPLAVKHLRLGEVNIFLSYMGESYMELEDVDNVHLKLHPLVYTNKTWTPRKLLLKIRRDVIFDLLSQVSRNFNNLGNFLNTRLLPKSSGGGAYSSTYFSTINSGHRSPATEPPSTLQQPLSQQHSSFFPVDKVSLPRSMSPGLRPKSPHEKDSRPSTGVTCGPRGLSLTPNPVKLRLPWIKGHKLVSPTSCGAPSKLPNQGQAADVSDLFDEDAGPLVIGPAAAAVAAAAEAAADYTGELDRRMCDEGIDGENAERSKTTEQHAKHILFGSQHVSGGSSTSWGSIGAGSTGGGGSSLRSIRLPQTFRRLAKSGRHHNASGQLGVGGSTTHAGDSEGKRAKY